MRYKHPAKTEATVATWTHFLLSLVAAILCSYLWLLFSFRHMGSGRIAASVDLSNFFQCWILNMGHKRVNTMVYIWIYEVTHCWSVWNAEGSYEAAFIRTDCCTVWTLCTGALSTSECLVWIPQQTSGTSVQTAAFSGLLCTAHTVCSLWGTNWFFLLIIWPDLRKSWASGRPGE